MYAIIITSAVMIALNIVNLTIAVFSYSKDKQERFYLLGFLSSIMIAINVGVLIFYTTTIFPIMNGR